MVHRETSSVVAIYCFGPQNNLLGVLSTYSYWYHSGRMPSTRRHKSTRHQLTFACHKKSRHVYALRTAYSLAQRLNFYILSLQYAKCPIQPAYHWCFLDDGVASPYILLQRSRDKVRLHLPEWGLKTIGEEWNFFRSCGVEWHTDIHFGDIQE